MTIAFTGGRTNPTAYGGTFVVDNAHLTYTLTGCTAGNSLIILLHWYDGGSALTISAITCSGETVDLHGSPFRGTNPAGNVNCQFASIKNIASTSDKTVDVTFSNFTTGGGMVLAEISGGNTSTLYQAGSFTNASGSSTAPTISVNPAVNHSLAWIVSSTDGLPSVFPSGYTEYFLSTAHWYDTSCADLDTAAGAANAVFTTLDGAWLLAAAIFAPAGPAVTTGRGRAL